MATIVFEINLETVNRYSASLPHAPTDSIDNMRETRSTWLPNLKNNNMVLKHGDQFTVSGIYAKYLEDNFTTGEGAVLKVISKTL